MTLNACWFNLLHFQRRKIILLVCNHPNKNFYKDLEKKTMNLTKTTTLWYKEAVCVCACVWNTNKTNERTGRDIFVLFWNSFIFVIKAWFTSSVFSRGKLGSCYESLFLLFALFPAFSTHTRPRLFCSFPFFLFPCPPVLFAKQCQLWKEETHPFSW